MAVKRTSTKRRTTGGSYGGFNPFRGLFRPVRRRRTTEKALLSRLLRRLITRLVRPLVNCFGKHLK